MNIINTIHTATRNFLANGGITFNGKRDLFEVFGYKRQLESKDYVGRYRRGDIARRLVCAYPDACWSTPPWPTDDKESQEESPWELAFKAIAKSNKLWKVIKQADILAQIHPYSIIVLGLSGSEQLSEPVLGGAKQLIYLRAFGADVATVATWVTDTTNPRFGLPDTYKLTVSSGRESVAPQTTDIIIHHSRVLHIAERTLEDPVNGIPFLESVWNRLDDLDKIAGSSAEVWWLNGRGGLNMDVDKEVELDTDTKKNLNDQIENYLHNLSRIFKTQGVDIKPINFAIEDPEKHADLQLILISGATAIPKRILTGSERGELASSQDENNFNTRIKERRTNFCQAEILEPLMERLIALGVMKAAKMWEWMWPDLDALSEKDAAVVAKDKASAIATYANCPTADTLIPPRQFVEDVLKMEYREQEVTALLDEEDAEMELDDNEPPVGNA